TTTATIVAATATGSVSVCFSTPTPLCPLLLPFLAVVTAKDAAGQVAVPVCTAQGRLEILYDVFPGFLPGSYRCPTGRGLAPAGYRWCIHSGNPRTARLDQVKFRTFCFYTDFWRLRLFLQSG